MLPAGLIDTGAIIAILDVDEEWHASCLNALPSLQMPLLTTEAVLTELFHLIAARNLSTHRTWQFVRSGAITVRAMDDSDLPVLQGLMAQYNDHPMDFADATLVHLAARESISFILTVDHDDFETYRIAEKENSLSCPHKPHGKREYSSTNIGSDPPEQAAARNRQLPRSADRCPTSALPCTSPALPGSAAPPIQAVSPAAHRSRSACRRSSALSH